jgi:competence protein ComFC
MDALYDICSPCHAKLPFTEETLIGMSGEIGRYDNTKNIGLNNCDYAICLWKYTGMVKDSLIRFKFYNKPSYYRTYAKLLAERIKKLTDAESFDMIISVPLHKMKELARGYNQAYIIAKSLSRELDIPEMSYLLERTRHTDTQSLLDRNDRQNNVKGAFKVANTEKLMGKTILLVDDILTTGFTMNECGRVLKEAGAVSVVAATMATGRNSYEK